MSVKLIQHRYHVNIMTKKEVLVRGVDDDVYRRAKSAAALLGIPMGTAVGEALRAWAERTALERELAENQRFVRTHWEKLAKNKGMAAVIAEGKLQRIFETLEEARRFASRFKIAMTFRVEEPPERHDLDIGPEMALQ
jgi:antitoxin component of RelBE/YafQ-DinJ toxin-antitoxin module